MFMFSIRNQIILVVLLSLVFTGMTGGIALFEMNRTRSDIQEIVHTDFPLTGHLAMAGIFQLRQSILIERAYRYLEYGHIGLLESIEKQLTELDDQIAVVQTMGRTIVYQPTMLPTRLAKTLFGKIHGNFLELRKDQVNFSHLLHKIFFLIKADKVADARNLFEELESQEAALVQKQEQILRAIKQLSAETTHRAEVAEKRGILVLGVILFISMVVSLFLSLRLAKGVILPLAQAIEIADRIAENKLDITVPSTQTPELKKLFTALAHMIQAIQDRKSLEHMLIISDKMSSIGLLAAGIAHEINNPLASAIMGLETLKMLQEDQSNDLILKRISSIQHNLDRASTIAKELLTFSRQKITNFQPVNLQDTIEGALTLASHKLKDVSVHQKWHEVPEVWGDYVKLEQVFMNILANAADAIRAGGEIKILGFREKDQIFVQIADNGQGMAEAVMAKVFDPFFTTKEIGRGTGLGLSICYNTMVEHGGAIDMSSVVGQGTTVTIRFAVRQGGC